MSSSFNPLYRYEVPSLKSATRKMKLDFTRPFVSRMKKIKKTKLSQDETALAIKLTHRAGNPENNKLEPELVGYPFLIGLKTPLTCEGLYSEVYARTRHLHERKGEFSECFFLDESQKNPIFQLFLSDENGIVNQDTEALPISSRPFRGSMSLNISILWKSRVMWYVVFLLSLPIYHHSNTNTLGTQVQVQRKSVCDTTQ